MNKRGDYKWDVMIALILGLIVLSLSLYFIFQEYFNEDMISQESCRQSVILRGNLPEGEKAGITYASFKDDFPLKCKTQVVTIDYEDTEKAGKLIADTLAQCWYLFGEGELQIFPADKYGFESFCTPCARIHFSPEVKSFYEKNEIDVSVALGKVFQDATYKTYLSQAFQPSVGVNWMVANSDKSINEFKFSGNKFLVDDAQTSGVLDSIQNYFIGGLADVNLPRYINSSNGDMVIFFSQVIRSDKNEVFGYNPLLFYFQIDQTPDPFKEVDKDFIEAGEWNAAMCDQFDGIPA
ncbi:MAG: hypothetical protein KKF50_04595 [Nanoarchaeota archaeon]|nr:hypothetical protein [Nanoarchaeota archaeon]